MKKILTLYGRPIVASGRQLTLAKQVYLVLREEIRLGHWQVGDRLPSAIALAQDSGLTISPIRRALERLSEEGFVRPSGRAGSFLASTGSRDSIGAGLVGIAVATPRDLAPDAPWHYAFRLQKTIEGAKRHGYAAEVRHVDEGGDLSAVDRRGALFSDAVTGVVCLVPYPHATGDALPPDRLPFVHWGPNLSEMVPSAVRDTLPFAHWGANSSECLPLVAGDLYGGFIRLTELVLSHGHRNILCLGAPSDAPVEREICFLGHDQAMRRAGLNANREAYERSLTTPRGGPRALRELLEAYGAIPRNRPAGPRRKTARRAGKSGATAVICAGYHTPRAIIALADAAGWRVPEDLSVAGRGHSRMRPEDSAYTLTCLDYDNDQIVDLCFEMLAKQARTRRYGVARALVQMAIQEGLSLGPARDAKPFARLGAALPKSGRGAAG